MGSSGRDGAVRHAAAAACAHSIGVFSPTFVNMEAVLNRIRTQIGAVLPAFCRRASSPGQKRRPAGLRKRLELLPGLRAAELGTSAWAGGHRDGASGPAGDQSLLLPAACCLLPAACCLLVTCCSPLKSAPNADSCSACAAGDGRGARNPALWEHRQCQRPERALASRRAGAVRHGKGRAETFACALFPSALPDPCCSMEPEAGTV